MSLSLIMNGKTNSISNTKTGTKTKIRIRSPTDYIELKNILSVSFTNSIFGSSAIHHHASVLILLAD